MKKKTNAYAAGNWLLIIVSSILILIGLALLLLAIIYIGNFGWWSLLIGSTGLTTTGCAVTSIVENNPSWIMLDLILP
jgi:hypothetical protein